MSKYHLLCIDPGTTHLAMAIFSGTNVHDIVMDWNMTYKVGHNPMKVAQAMHAALDFLTDIAGVNQNVGILVEFQAPIGMTHVARWNAYVEGCVTTVACENYDPSCVYVVNASACKRKLGLATGNYAMNKQLSMAFAQRECPTIGSHHVADCYVLARYFFDYGQRSMEKYKVLNI